MSDQNAEDILQRLEPILQRLDRIEITLEKSIDRNEAYQKAADRIADRVSASSERVANLDFGVITASAAVLILAPAVKVVAEYFTR